MKNTQPFNRQVEVIVGPLAEWEGGGPENAAIIIYGDGTNDNLRIKFSVPKHVVSTAAPTTISLYNLSPGTRSALDKRDTQVVLKAGWSNLGMLSIFKGSIMAVVSRRDGADIITDLLCTSGGGAINRTNISQTFGAGFPLSKILSDIARVFPGVAVDEKLIVVNDVYLGNQGYSSAGSAKDALDKLSRVHGFSWWISDGLFHALGDDKIFNKGSIVISANNGFLRGAEPMLSTPLQVQRGVSIESLLNPFVTPGGSISLTTKINPSLDGSYKVHELTHNGDTHADDWTTSIQTYLIGGVDGQ